MTDTRPAPVGELNDLEVSVKQARFLFRSIVEAGPSRPNARKWEGIHRLAAQMDQRLTEALAASVLQPVLGEGVEEQGVTGATSGEDRAGGAAHPSPAVSAKGAHPIAQGETA